LDVDNRHLGAGGGRRGLERAARCDLGDFWRWSNGNRGLHARRWTLRRPFAATAHFDARPGP